MATVSCALFALAGPPPVTAASCSPTLQINPATAQVANGGNVTLVVTLSNTGTGTCSGVYLSLYYPSELTFVSANPSATAGGYYWNFPSLVAGQTKAISVLAKAQTTQPLPRSMTLDGCLNAGGLDNCTAASVSIVAGTPPSPSPSATPSPSVAPSASPSPTPTVPPTSTPSPSPTAPPTIPPTACANLAPNLPPNPGFEVVSGGLPQSWSTQKYGTNTASFSHLATGGWNGTRAVRVQITSYTSGDAAWVHGAVPVTGGRLYEYRDKYQATYQGEIDAVYTMADGSIQYQYVGTATKSTNWNEFYALFRVPTGAVSVQVIHDLYGVGTLVLDDVVLREYHPVGFNRGIVTLTFDDHPPLTYGLPVFAKYGAETTHYIETAQEPRSGYPESTTPQTVRTLRDAGHEIGSHTVTHPFLLQIPLSQVITELVDSQSTLRQWLSEPNGVRQFASPYGETDANIRGIIAQYYDSHRSVDAGYNDRCNFERHNLKVQNVVDTTTLSEIREWVDQASSDKTWLILVYHAVSPNAALGRYNTHPDDLDAHLAYMRAKGMAIKTVGHALDELLPQLSLATPTPTPTASPSPSPSPSPTPTPSPSATPVPSWTPAPNLIPNPSFETKKANASEPANWTKTKTGNNNAAFSWPTSAHSGGRSAKVQVTNYVSGDAYWAHAQKAVSGGKTYELSGYYRSNVYTNVVAHFVLSNGNHEYRSLYVPPKSPTEWNFFYAQFDAPGAAVSVSVYQALEQKGWVQTDDLVLREYRPLGFVRGLASITVDADIVKYGMPVVDGYGFKTTQVMTPGFIDENDVRPDYINPPTLRRLYEEGHEIAAHSMTHPFLPLLDLSQAQSEIEQSRLVLATWLETAIPHFAAPFGEVTPSVLSFIKSKFASHRGTDPGYNSRDNFDRYNLKVHYVHSDTTAAQIRAWADRAKAERTYMVLLYHDVNPDPNFEVDSLTPAAFNAHMKALQDAGLPVLTVTQAMAEIQPQV